MIEIKFTLKLNVLDGLFMGVISSVLATLLLKAFGV